MEKYESILSLPYNKSTKRRNMSLNDRAAQFAPFSALNGYEESLKEVSRVTIEKKELTQDDKDIISAKLNFITVNKLTEEIKITYFIPDNKKTGGKYQTISKQIKRIDEPNKIIYFLDKTSIKIEDIIDIKSITIDSIFIDF